MTSNEILLYGALKIAQNRLYEICGASMAIAHGEPENNLHKAINEMGPDMNTVRFALDVVETVHKKYVEECVEENSGKSIFEL